MKLGYSTSPAFTPSSELNEFNALRSATVARTVLPIEPPIIAQIKAPELPGKPQKTVISRSMGLRHLGTELQNAAARYVAGIVGMVLGVDPLDLRRGDAPSAISVPQIAI
ncbi:hypothetical protein N5A92_27180 [Chelativorans sp. EGI FJ00035]|uniref:Uncharacterized protein n=1 Tax=Chelativorans salis TaxID=2978478 RepID=A0ABT2LVZ7_9HYPH|nr:hypothetical protein [Chelativorans sp. EGI FJ00035]